MTYSSKVTDHCSNHENALLNMKRWQCFTAFSSIAICDTSTQIYIINVLILKCYYYFSNICLLEDFGHNKTFMFKTQNTNFVFKDNLLNLSSSDRLSPTTRHPLTLPLLGASLPCTSSSSLPCCSCLSHPSGMESVSETCPCLGPSQFCTHLQPLLRIFAAAPLPRWCPPRWHAGASGAGIRGNGRGQRCWAGTWGTRAHRWRGAWRFWGDTQLDHCNLPGMLEVKGEPTRCTTMSCCNTNHFSFLLIIVNQN